MTISTLMIINWCLLIFLMLLAIGYIVLLIGSISDVKLRYQEMKTGDVLALTKSHAMPPVTVLMAAFNEEDIILNATESVLRSDYPHTSLIVINDGSTDKTLPLLIKQYNLHKTNIVIPELIKTGAVKAYYISETHKNVVVIDKEHVGKSDSLNVGVNACRTPLCITVDADTLLEPDAISELVFYCLTRPHAVAVGGAPYILNGCSYKNGAIEQSRMSYNLLYSLQALEYLRSFLINRSGWNPLGGSLSFSGTFTLFETKELVAIGGFDVGNPANDFEVITHLQAHKLEADSPYQIGFTPAAAAWTEVPGTLKEYWHQRFNWQWGTLRSLMRHIKMFFNPRYKMIGLFNFPFFLLGEALGPVVEFIAYLTVFFSWYLGIFTGYTVLLMIAVCWGFVAVLTMATALISIGSYNKYGRLRDIPWLLFVSAVESFGFRQFVMICRVWATLCYFFGGFYFWKHGRGEARTA